MGWRCALTHRRLHPVFLVSSVTGANLGLLMRYLETVEALPRGGVAKAVAAAATSTTTTDDAEIRIEDVYTVPGTRLGDRAGTWEGYQ